MKNRTIIGIVCMVLAVTVMFGISPIINKVASGKIEVIQLKKSVEQGQVINNEDVIKVQIGSYGIKDGYLKDINQIVGKYAVGKLFSNTNIYPEMITEKAESASDIFKTLNGNEQAISITIDSFANGLSGKLQNGDVVSLFYTMQNEKQAISPKELKYVKVITTTTAKGMDIDNLKPDKDGNYSLPTTVTLLVNSVQAQLLAGFEGNGKIHLSLIYRGDDENANKFLKAQSEVLKDE